MEYTQFLNIIETDDPRFNEIWDENTTLEGTKEESLEPGPITIKIAPAPTPVPTFEPHEDELKPQNKEVGTSSAEAEDQSVVSTISKKTFISTSSSLDLTSVLVDIPVHREVSEITAARLDRKRTLEKALDSMFHDLYESIVGEKVLNVTCANEEVILQGEDELRPFFMESDNTTTTNEPSIKSLISLPHSKLDETQKSSEPSKLEESLSTFEPPKLDESLNKTEQENPCACPEQETIGDTYSKSLFVEDPNQDAAPKSAPRNVVFKILFDSETITSFPEFLTVAASQFLSSPLNGDDEVSQVSIYFAPADTKDDKVFVSLEKSDTDISTLPSMTLEEKRLDERNLLDTVLIKMSNKPQNKGEITEDISEDKTTLSTEEENVTEGLGLNLPPPVSPQKAPEIMETEEPTMIEVEASGEIVVNEVDSRESSTDSEDSVNCEKPQRERSEPYKPERVSSNQRDVFIYYRPGGYQAEDAASQSQDSDASNTSVHTQPKQASGLKSLFKPRWRRKKMRLFKTTNKDKTNEVVSKPRKSMTDSPGSSTVGTNRTEMSVASYATLEFSKDHPVNPKKLPFLLRRTRA